MCYHHISMDDKHWRISCIPQIDISLLPAVLAIALFGGVRIMSQLLFLKYTSPTPLALSNICIQLLTSISSGLIFGKKISPQFLIGVSISIVFSGLYAYLKINEQKKTKHDELVNLQRRKG